MCPTCEKSHVADGVLSGAMLGRFAGGQPATAIPHEQQAAGTGRWQVRSRRRRRRAHHE